MKRVLCLYLPFLSTDRLSKPGDAGAADELPRPRADAPIVTVAPQGRTYCLVHLSARAAALGLSRGQTLAEAQARAPHIAVYDDDPQADRRELESLAAWADCIAPVVQITGHDTLLADVTGCAGIFEGEPNLLRHALNGLEARGFAVRGALADTPGAAWAFAHAHPNAAFISQPGQASADLSPLPAWSLRIAPDTVESLALAGVKTIESLLYLPRASLAARFGPALLERIDQALGRRAERLTPYRPHAALASRFPLGFATTQRELLEEALHRALKDFCIKLAARASGVRQLFLTFHCPEVRTDTGPAARRVTLPLHLFRPTRSPAHLFDLLRAMLDRLWLPGAADSLTIWASQLERYDHPQGELFAVDTIPARSLEDLIDRLAVRLGSRAVVQARLQSEHEPQRAYRYESMIEPPIENQTHQDTTENLPTGPRPLRLMRHAQEVAAASIVPDGPPISFRLQNRHYTVARRVGPERIETGWWRGPHLERDYYRVWTECGARCWIFRNRQTGRWFLQGWFD